MPMRITMKYSETIDIIGSMQFEKHDIVKIVESFDNYNLKEDTRFAKAHKRYKCKFSTRKPIRALFTLDFNNSDWFIKANLFTIHRYIGRVYGMSETIRDIILGGYNCKDCSPSCKGGVQFEYNCEAYNKCIGVNFNFQNLNSDEWVDVIELVKSEIKVRTNKE